jgi:hypothetical protein
MASRVAAAEAPVLGVAVVHRDPAVASEHPCGLHADAAPATVAGNQGELLGGRRMEPEALRVDAGPGLVVDHHRGGHQPVAQVDQEVPEDGPGSGQQPRHPAGRDLHAHQVPQRLGSPRHWEVLVGEQVGTHPRDYRAIHRRDGGLGRELAGGLAPARTAPGLDDMGGDDDLGSGESASPPPPLRPATHRSRSTPWAGGAR